MYSNINTLKLLKQSYNKQQDEVFSTPTFWWIMLRVLKKQTAERSLRNPKGILERHLRDTWKTPERLPELLAEPKSDSRTSHEHEYISFISQHFLICFRPFFLFFFRFIKHLYKIWYYPMPNLALLLRSTVEFKNKWNKVKSNQHILTLLSLLQPLY